MKVKLKHGDSYIEVDSEFDDEMIDFYIKNNDLDDTKEINLEKIKEVSNSSE